MCVCGRTPLVAAKICQPCLPLKTGCHHNRRPHSSTRLQEDGARRAAATPRRTLSSVLLLAVDVVAVGAPGYGEQWGQNTAPNVRVAKLVKLKINTIFYPDKLKFKASHIEPQSPPQAAPASQLAPNVERL